MSQRSITLSSAMASNPSGCTAPQGRTSVLRIRGVSGVYLSCTSTRVVVAVYEGCVRGV